MSSYQEITPEQIEASRKVIMGGGVAGSLPLIVKSGKGAVLTDTDGKEYIDCTSQAWTMFQGFSHPKIVEAVREQVGLYTHIRTSFDTPPKLLLAAKISDLAPGDVKLVNFSLHGSVAIEGALKLALRNRPGTKNVLSFYDGYHGRTLASMALSWPHPDNGFLHYMNNVVRVPQAYCYRCPYGCEYPSCGLLCARMIETTIEKGVDGEVAALFMEPMQGNGGMIEYPREFYQAVRDICDRHNIILVWDEMQTGFGRLGYMFYSDRCGVVPDIIVFGKAVGGGFPLAGALSSTRLQPFSGGDQGFTFANFPVSMVAGLAGLEVIEEEGLLRQAKEKGEYITRRLREMRDQYEIIGDIRGPGLMIGIELVKDRKTKEPFCEAEQHMVHKGLEYGVIFGGSKYNGLGNVVKIKPPAVITYDEIDRVLEVFEKLLRECGDLL